MNPYHSNTAQDSHTDIHAIERPARNYTQLDPRKLQGNSTGPETR